MLHIDVHNTTLSFCHGKIIFFIPALSFIKKIIRDEGATSARAMRKTKLSHKKLFFTSLSHLIVCSRQKTSSLIMFEKGNQKKFEFIFNVQASLSRYKGEAPQEKTKFMKHNYSIEIAWYHNYESLNENLSIKRKPKRKKSVKIVRELDSRHILKWKSIPALS